ncbi:DUF4238 domain-containing protein [Lentzea sp. BCCO 10_0856]|uniref:DUF4238 domain-containing protein n=1 Tax=Lentzea miocenica TaxID=3095431 RepID=A0ABU4SU65_9PSEU|nr:DUF4238 domain-containing protein [Lentzea sp. BCCO 10_0856]MDX8029395.1 DUF4238 domain-containing protein [Lentzea sp. BCCO 10_0856]
MLAPDPAAEEYAALLRRRRAELAPHLDKHVTSQHVVSRVVLHRFGRIEDEKAGLQLARMDLHHLERRPKLTGPKGCGKVDNFIRYASEDAEKTWGRIETRLPVALAAADDGSILSHPDLIDIIKEVMALHVVRGKESAVIHKEAWSWIEAASRHALRGQIEVLRQFTLARTGLYLTGADWADRAIDQLHANTEADYDTGFLFRMQQERAFEKVRTFIHRHGLEFLESREAHFLIGDVPAVATRQDRQEVGLLGGIAVDDAHSMVMPLGPSLTVATSPINARGVVPPDIVEHLNKVQVAAAQDEVYFHPASGLEDFVRREMARMSGDE